MKAREHEVTGDETLCFMTPNQECNLDSIPFSWLGKDAYSRINLNYDL